MMRIYLDHNAGSPLRTEVATAVRAYLRDAGGNPSSVHHSGQQARRKLETARAQVAALVGAQPREIVFTSGGTESNSLAVNCALRSLDGRRKIVSTAIEHSSILAPLADFESRGVEVVRVGCDRDGRIAREDLIAAVDHSTAVVTIGLVNSEVGTIQDLTGVADATARMGAILHVDAAQALGRIAIDVREVRCDLLTLSAHKIGGLAGTGALFVRQGLALAPPLSGISQESGLRAGTPNLAGAVAFGAASKPVLEEMAQFS